MRPQKFGEKDIWVYSGLKKNRDEEIIRFSINREIINNVINTFTPNNDWKHNIIMHVTINQNPLIIILNGGCILKKNSRSHFFFTLIFRVIGGMLKEN